MLIPLAIGGHPALRLHSSNEPGEFSQWLCHDDSTINIVVDIIILYYIIMESVIEKGGGSFIQKHW